MVDVITTVFIVLGITAVMGYVFVELAQFLLERPLYITRSIRWVRGYIRDRGYIKDLRRLTQWLHRRLQC